VGCQRIEMTRMSPHLVFHRSLAMAVLLACNGLAVAAEYRTGQPVMGTVLQVTVVDSSRERARHLAEAAIELARHWDDVLTTWRREGELAQLNRSAGRTVAVSSDLSAALVQMLRMYDESGGAFDPAVGERVDYYRTVADGTPTSSLLDLRRALWLRNRQARLKTGATLDAGGIGKGIALDAIAHWLRAQRVTGAFLDFGGSSQTAIGTADDGSIWSVAVAGGETGVLLGTIGLRDRSLSTSRSSAPGDPAGPIINPADGTPVAPGRLVTVLATSAARADAWSTALVVSGPAGLARAQRYRIEALIDESGSLATTKGFTLARQASETQVVAEGDRLQDR